MGYTLFEDEEQIFEQALSGAERLFASNPNGAEEMAALAKEYGKLLKTTKKLVRISDKNEDKLNRMGKELAEKNAQLEVQKLELLKAAELREEVGRITRHDLKNPLQNILSVPELLLMTLELEDYQRDMLMRVKESGYAMLNMINLSLDLFKMEQGTYRLKEENVDICKVLDRVRGDQQSIWESKDLAIEIQLNGGPVEEAEPMYIVGENLLCYSMFSNLIRNALDASPEGENLTISVDSETGTVAIRNRGEVPEDIRKSFFEKYVTSGKAHGTGLGTYSAKLIIEVHGGTIALDSSEPDYTTITVTFPVN